MKKSLVLFLAFILCITLLIGCGDKAVTDDGGKSTSTNSSADSAGTLSDASSSIVGGEIDILAGLPYTIECVEKNTLTPAEYVFSDNGKLNDGLFRSIDDLENGKNGDMSVYFEGTSGYNFIITFELDGRYDAYRLVAHNCDLSFSFLKLEIGDDLNNMSELDFTDDHENTADMLIDNYADFELTNIKFFRITVTTGTSSRTSLDELSLLGYLKGTVDKRPESEDESDTSAPAGELDKRLVGTWGGDDPEIIEKGGDDYKVVFVFAEDGTGSYKQGGFDLPLTWSCSDDVLYMEVALVGELTKPYSFEGKYLYMPDEDGRNTKFVPLD